MKTPNGVPLPPLVVRDTANQGYIHAPSVNHAATAAVLRNGYAANATPEQPDLLKVNLSSERVRRALKIIEGIRGGKSLAALLGYEFECGGCTTATPWRNATASYIRCAWCSRSPHAARGPARGNRTIQSIQARNVRSTALARPRHVRTPPAANCTYPFGFPNAKLPTTCRSRTPVHAEARTPARPPRRGRWTSR